MHPEDTDGVAKSVDKISMIWVYTICQDQIYLSENLNCISSQCAHGKSLIAWKLEACSKIFKW